MNEKKYQEEINNIKADTIFKEQLKSNLSAIETKQKNRIVWVKPVSYITSFVVVLIFIYFQLFYQSSINSNVNVMALLNENYQKKINTIGLVVIGQTVIAKDINQIIGSNPAGEFNHLETLPVYYNMLERDNAGAPSRNSGYNYEQMQELLKNTANKLEIEFDDIQEYTIDSYNNQPVEPYVSSIMGISGNVKVRVDKDGRIFIDGLDNNFTNTENLTILKKETLQVVEKYQKLFNIKNPILGITSDYYFDGTINWQRKIYANSDNKLEQIYNYNFTNFIITENAISLSYSFIEKVADYSIISEQKATDLLLEGKYYSVSGIDFEITDEKIAGIELRYRIDKNTKYVIPFYLFWIDTSDELINETYQNIFHSYSAYYVPAINENDLTNFGEIIFSFN